MNIDKDVIINQVLDFLDDDCPRLNISAYLEDVFKGICKENDYTGKKDINNKKIYSNSSIVEATYSHMVGDKYIVSEQLVGYFIKNEARLSYELLVLENKSSNLSYETVNNYFGNISNCKIIDTIQENKLRLIK